MPIPYLNCITTGDALRLLLTLPDACVDAVITDPPYSSGGAFRGDRGLDPTAKYQQSENRNLYTSFSGDTRDGRSYAYWSTLWLAECLRIAKPGSPIGVFSDWRQLPATSDAVQAGGWVWRGIVPWDKTESARPQRGRFRAQCEYVIWGSKGRMWNEGRTDCPPLPGVVRQAVISRDKQHIAGKPLAVMRALLAICPPGGIVLDPFAGSGSTCHAAVACGMDYIGFDIDPTWTRVSDARTAVVQSVMPGFRPSET